MSSFLIEPWSSEKSYTVPFKRILLCSSFVKSFDTLHKTNYTNLSYSFNIFESLRLVLTTIVVILVMPAKLATLGLVKMVF